MVVELKRATDKVVLHGCLQLRQLSTPVGAAGTSAEFVELAVNDRELMVPDLVVVLLCLGSTLQSCCRLEDNATSHMTQVAGA